MALDWLARLWSFKGRPSAYGYEIQADLVKKSRDIFKLDLSEADVVTLWLLPYLNGKLIRQLDKMKPGSRIVSLDFDMMDIVKPDKVIEINVPLDKDLCRKRASVT